MPVRSTGKRFSAGKGYFGSFLLLLALSFSYILLVNDTFRVTTTTSEDVSNSKSYFQDQNTTSTKLSKFNIPRALSHIYASEIVNQKVFVSLTTIQRRLYGVPETIISILNGQILPDHIFVYLSSSPYMLDTGVTDEDIRTHLSVIHEIKKHIYPNISIKFTANIGPHRKLLPLLHEHYKDDNLLVTVDDHETYMPWFLYTLVSNYMKSNRASIVAIRARRMGLCLATKDNWVIGPYTSEGRGLWPEALPGTHEMLLLPTGNGGVLYRPKFFHEIVFDPKFRDLTSTGDDIMFRFSTLVKGIKVLVAKPVNYKSQYHSIRRKLLTAEEWNNDPRKTVSLASQYNVRGGNNAMISNATQYLEKMGVLNMQKHINRYMFIERSSCIFGPARMLISLMHSYPSFSNLEQAGVMLQYIYDKNCGIIKCER